MSENETDNDPNDTERRRIHFLTDVRDLGAAYECRRCGHATATKVEMYEHRKGLVSRCFRERLKQKIRSLRPDTFHSNTDQDE